MKNALFDSFEFELTKIQEDQSCLRNFVLVLHVCKRAGNPENLDMTVYVPPQKKKKKKKKKQVDGKNQNGWKEGLSLLLSEGRKPD